MMNRSAFFAACCIAATAVCLPLSACDSAESRARAAYTDYQAASAAGDLQAARIALLKLVAAQDDVASNWQELGKVQVQLGAYQDAYYAYTRAHELDRTDVETVATLAQLALLSGNMDLAEQHAKNLELLRSDHPVIKLAYGYVALKRMDLDEADKNADSLLAAYPSEPGATLLKSRIFAARGEFEQAIGILENQAKARPDDAGALKSLTMLYQRKGDWRGVESAAKRLWSLNPKASENGLTVVDAALRAGDFEAARQASEDLMQPDAPTAQVEAVLDLWSEHWTGPDAIAEARRLAEEASPGQKLAYAGYFNDVGAAKDALALTGDKPVMPLQRWNLSRNALIAGALAQAGRASEAKELFDGILVREPDHVYALRGRINLEIRTGQAKAAIVDAQRLVSIEPKSARDRLLLARAYAAAGNVRQVDRTLWNAFHEIPANLQLYEVLRARVLETDGPDSARSLDDEFAQQRDVTIAREFI
ncbi:MAG: hypothetical protein HOP91_08445 [Sphingomonas sp.]|nr:hypothetical protein [Sphingomonas sp.]